MQNDAVEGFLYQGRNTIDSSSSLRIRSFLQESSIPVNPERRRNRNVVKKQGSHLKLSRL